MKTRSISMAAVLVTLVLVAGCSSVPRTQAPERGILQGSGASGDSSARAPLPISIPPSITQNSGSGFVWPVKEGKVSSFFGSRKRDYHEGIDIKSNRGNPIFAAKDGDVIYSGRKIHGYGNMIVVKHLDGLSTVYAHNRKNLVKAGAHVTQGELLGYVGATGKATGPHLHFEIRKGELPQDPLLFLPQVRTPAMAHQ